jgi:hypothetical protein
VLGDTVELTLRVLPTDLDLNGLMNNGRYLTLIDLALVTLFIRSGFARVCLSQGWRPMSGGSDPLSSRAHPVPVLHAALHAGRLGRVLELLPFRVHARWPSLRDGFRERRDSKPRRLDFQHCDLSIGYEQASPPFPHDLSAWIAADRLLAIRVRNTVSTKVCAD